MALTEAAIVLALFDARCTLLYCCDGDVVGHVFTDNIRHWYSLVHIHSKQCQN